MTKPGPDDKVYPPFKLAILVNALAAEGVPLQAVLKGTGISADAATSHLARLSFNQMLQAHRNADRLTRDPQFAYHLGRRFHATALGMYGFAFLSSPSFRQTLDFVAKYRQLSAPLVDVALHQEGFSVVWKISPPLDSRVDARMHKHIVELQCAMFLTLHRDVMGEAFSPREIRLAYGPPDDAAKYPDLFGCPVLFGQPENQFRFDAACLDRRADLGNELTHTFAKQICDGLLEEFRLSIGVTGEVQHMLLANLMRAKRFEEVAGRLNMSARTLRRKLREENTSYRQLVDELRKDVAIKYLRETDLTVEDIASTLGFSDAANFRQAFRRWTKAAPHQFRDTSPSA